MVTIRQITQFLVGVSWRIKVHDKTNIKRHLFVCVCIKANLQIKYTHSTQLF